MISGSFWVWEIWFEAPLAKYSKSCRAVTSGGIGCCQVPKLFSGQYTTLLKKLSFQNFLCPFSALFVKFGLRSFQYTFFVGPLFVLFGRNFGHLATLASEPGKLHNKDDIKKRRCSHTFSEHSFADPPLNTWLKILKNLLIIFLPIIYKNRPYLKVVSSEN